MGDSFLLKNYGEAQTLWVSERHLRACADVCGDVLRVRRCQFKASVPPSKREGALLPATGKSWRYMAERGLFYYDFDFIPNRAPNYYRSKIGKKESIIKELLCPEESAAVRESALVKMQALLFERYNKEMMLAKNYFQYEAAFKQKERHAFELAEAWGWLRLIKDIRQDNYYIRLGLDSLKSFFGVVVKLLKKRELKGLAIKNERYLFEKLRDFPFELDTRAQWCAMIHGGAGNQNARIVGTTQWVDEDTGEVMDMDIHQTLISFYYMNGANAGLEFRTKLYEKYYLPSAAALGVTPIALRTFMHHTNAFSHKFLADRARYGEDYYKKNALTYVAQKKLQHSGSLWVADGSGLKLAYRGSKGAATLYMNRVFDVASGALLGWSFSDTHEGGESEKLIMAAVQRAVAYSNNYGSFEFLSDNGGVFGKKAVKEKLQKLFRKVRTIEVGNSQGNDAERLIKLMNDLGRQFSNWSGQFQAKEKEWRANPDLLKDNLVSKEEAYRQAESLINQWNSQVGIDGLTRLERYEKLRHPELHPIPAQALRHAFGQVTEVDLSYMRGFVKVYHNGKGHLFVLENQLEIIKEINKLTGYKGDMKVKVCWNDLAADVYTPGGVYITTCLPVAEAHKSAAEATPESRRALAAHLARKSAQRDVVTSFENKVSAISERLPYGALAAGKKVVKEDSNAQELALLNEALKENRQKKLPKKTIAERAFEQL